MKKIYALFVVVAAFLSAFTAQAQYVGVSGNVTEVSGEPVSGAIIQVKGNLSSYTTTDTEGFFQFKVPANAVLVVSCLGYITEEIPVNGQGSINVVLETDSQVLDDVIVVAYGTQLKEATTGAVASVKNDKIASAPVTSVDKMLSGKMAGVQLQSYSGQPGSTTTIRVRGTSSVNAGNEPLWVVDGIPIIADDNRSASNTGVGSGSNTAFLNPNDIESITVLKDAAAASVYGSRAANGVILVTTKTGKAGKAKFTARVKFGAQQLANDNNYRPMTGEELVEYWRAAAVNGGYNPDDPTSDYYVPYSLLENGTHNWYKDLTRVGTMQEYEVNATGGNNRGSYYSSLSYHRNEGVYYGVDYSRFSARINADYKLLKSLTSGARVNVSYNNSNSGPMGGSFYSNPAQAMFSLLPWEPLKNEDGTYSKPASNNGHNPRAYAEYNENNDKEYRFNGNIFLEWKPIKQLTIKTLNGAEASFINSREYAAPEPDPDGETDLYTYNIQETRYTTSNTITYQDKYAGRHSLRVLLGQEAMINTYQYLGVHSPKVDPAIPYPTTSKTADDSGTYGYSQYSLLSFFGVLDYSDNDTFFLSASLRADGSSLFGSKNKWGLFWSASASWNIHKELFMQGAQKWLSQLKLRGSYGVNGNNNISTYRAYGVYATTEYNQANGMYPSRPDNPNLSWEKNKTWNVGLDFGFLDNKINGSVDVYSRVTTDMLLDKRVPYTTGFGSNFLNTGSIKNSGVEIVLNATPIQTRDWFWTLGGNIAFNRSKVLDLAGSGFIECWDSRYYDTDSGSGSTPVRIVEGMSMYNFYIRDWAGVNPSNGDGLYWTEEGTLTNDRTKARYYYAGSPEPKFTGGFNTALSWKGIELSAYFEFVYGNKVMTNNWYISDGEDALSKNSQNSALNYWKQPGDTGVNPRPIAGGSNVWYAGYSTRFLEDGSYLRIKDVTLSYTFPEKLMKSIHMNTIKIYVSALNPFTFHHVNAFDPELGPLGYSYGGAHTMVKSFIGGIEVSF